MDKSNVKFPVIAHWSIINRKKIPIIVKFTSEFEGEVISHPEFEAGRSNVSWLSCYASGWRLESVEDYEKRTTSTMNCPFKVGDRVRVKYGYGYEYVVDEINELGQVRLQNGNLFWNLNGLELVPTEDVAVPIFKVGDKVRDLKGYDTYVYTIDDIDKHGDIRMIGSGSYWPASHFVHATSSHTKGPEPAKAKNPQSEAYNKLMKAAAETKRLQRVAALGMLKVPKTTHGPIEIGEPEAYDPLAPNRMTWIKD